METKKLAGTALSVTLKTFVFALMVIVLIFVGSKAFSFGYDVFHETAMASADNADEISVTIPAGASLSDLSSILKSNRLIEDKTIFLVQAELAGFKKILKPGTYTLKTSMTPSEIMSALTPQEETTTGGK